MGWLPGAHGVRGPLSGFLRFPLGVKSLCIVVSLLPGVSLGVHVHSFHIRGVVCLPQFYLFSQTCHDKLVHPMI